MHHSFPKLESIFMLMIKSAKQLKIDFFLNSYYTYPHIEFKHDFGPKKYKF
jgi:hypothetical protein